MTALGVWLFLTFNTIKFKKPRTRSRRDGKKGSDAIRNKKPVVFFCIQFSRGKNWNGFFYTFSRLQSRTGFNSILFTVAELFLMPSKFTANTVTWWDKYCQWWWHTSYSFPYKFRVLSSSLEFVVPFHPYMSVSIAFTQSHAQLFFSRLLSLHFYTRTWFI